MSVIQTGFSSFEYSSFLFAMFGNMLGKIHFNSYRKQLLTYGAAWTCVSYIFSKSQLLVNIVWVRWLINNFLHSCHLLSTHCLIGILKMLCSLLSDLDFRRVWSVYSLHSYLWKNWDSYSHSYSLLCAIYLGGDGLKCLEIPRYHLLTDQIECRILSLNWEYIC